MCLVKWVISLRWRRGSWTNSCPFSPRPSSATVSFTAAISKLSPACLLVPRSGCAVSTAEGWEGDDSSLFLWMPGNNVSFGRWMPLWKRYCSKESLVKFYVACFRKGELQEGVQLQLVIPWKLALYLNEIPCLSFRVAARKPNVLLQFSPA